RAKDRHDMETRELFVAPKGDGPHCRLRNLQPTREVLRERLLLADDGQPLDLVAQCLGEPACGFLARLRIEGLAAAILQRHTSHPAAIGTFDDTALVVATLAWHTVLL